MPDLLSTLGLAVVVFASTNVDDILLLAAFFADPRFSARTVVAGQYLGMGVLVLASAAAGAAALVVPEGYTALLGVVPLALGLRVLWRGRNDATVDGAARESERPPEHGDRSQLLTVAAVTIANGGDNLGVYIPLFASAPRTIPVFVAVFAAMTALWCWAGHALVNHRVAGAWVRRVGHAGLPFVLVALGLWILAGARLLF